MTQLSPQLRCRMAQMRRPLRIASRTLARVLRARRRRACRIGAAARVMRVAPAVVRAGGAVVSRRRSRRCCRRCCRRRCRRCCRRICRRCRRRCSRRISRRCSRRVCSRICRRICSGICRHVLLVGTDGMCTLFVTVVCTFPLCSGKMSSLLIGMFVNCTGQAQIEWLGLEQGIGIGLGSVL